jgi:ABC-2 type transport system ATP-binding protein
MERPIIDIRDLTVDYRTGNTTVRALDDVSLSVRQGEIFGLLGPNGAGKTTLLSCVEGLRRPDAGQVIVDGIDVAADPGAAKSKLGIQLQRSALLDDLTAAELVYLYAGLYEVYLTRDQVRALLARFDLADKAGTYARRLSGGQQQRLALTLAVANDPQIVLLDEPTAALDPRGRRQVWEMIRQLHVDGRTVIITTHAMEEAEALCDRVAIIDQGRIVACDSPAGLVAALGALPVLKTSLDLPLADVTPLPGVRQARYTGAHLELATADPQSTLVALQRLATDRGRPVGEVTVRQPNLEDVFLSLTGHGLDNYGPAGNGLNGSSLN